MDVEPKFYGDPADRPWKRWATAEIKSLTRAFATIAQNATAGRTQMNAANATLAGQVAAIAAAQASADSVVSGLATQQAALTTAQATLAATVADLQVRKIYTSVGSGNFSFTTQVQTPATMTPSISITLSAPRKVQIFGSCRSLVQVKAAGSTEAQAMLQIGVQNPGLGFSTYTTASLRSLDSNPAWLETRGSLAAQEVITVPAGTTVFSLSATSVVSGSGTVYGLLERGVLTVQVLDS